jgi:hypothetical protein
MKPANKTEAAAAERSAVDAIVAESVEPRAGTKGNVDQQSTCRTQSRVSVSQALDRIRKVARETKKEKFTALFHHVSTELLEEAFFELKEGRVDPCTAAQRDISCQRSWRSSGDQRLRSPGYP